MKRSLVLLVTLMLVAGCSKQSAKLPPEAAVPPTPPPTTQPAEKEPAKPPEPMTTEGPVYLLAQPEKPLWPGPASVVVENSPQSRPQTGLMEADMVVEGLSESEITRYLAFYWSKPAAKIGPVRSARTWSVAMADAYRATYSHAGGNNDALAILRQSWGPSNLDEIFGSGGYFVRTRDRQPPHNLYTSTDLIATAIKDRKIDLKAPSVTPRASAEVPSAGAVTRADVQWHKHHQTNWEWKDGQYRRIDDGQPHTLEGDVRIGAPNLVFLQIQGVDSGWELGWALDFPRGGKATVVTAGQSWEGTWSLGKGGFAIKPASGKVPVLAPGNVWVHLITQDSTFSLSK